MNTSETYLIENTLDIRKLFRLLWNGKVWIIGCAAFFALVAMIYSALVRQEWTSIAIIDTPTVDILGDYYLQQQWLSSFEITQHQSSDGTPTPAVDNAYNEFKRQFSAYNNRRDFWLQSHYVKTFRTENGNINPVELDTLINNIQFIPTVANTINGDTLSLTAESAKEAYQQLDAYITFVTARTVEQLNRVVMTERKAKQTALLSSLRQQQNKLSLFIDTNAQDKEKSQSDITEHEKTASDNKTHDAFSDSDLVPLNTATLNAQLAMLKTKDIDYAQRYLQDSALYNELIALPKITNTYKPFRYLRSPSEPIKRVKPRRLFLMILWGSIGALCGAGIALTCGRNSRGNTMLSMDK